MKKILVVGQTPPPYGGQANMIKYMLDGKYEQIKMFHVRMSFTKAFTERGKFALHKVTHLFAVIWNIWVARFKYGTDRMYYPLSCAPKVAVLRDAIILGTTRFLFKKVVYHFHAAGISEELPKYNKLLRFFVYGIESKPNMTITSSEYNPKDGEYLKSKDVRIMPLGIPDDNVTKKRTSFGSKPYLTLMHMGLLNGSKGEGYVLEAVRELNERGYDVHFILTGQFESDEYKKDFYDRVKRYSLSDKFDYRGVVTGEAKKRAFLDSDIFCFPSYFHSESFGVVLLEGMMYQMPVIASRRRGLISVVEEGQNGYLVDVHNSSQIADAVEVLYKDRQLLEKMAKRGREIFEEKYVLSQYISNIENILKDL